MAHFAELNINNEVINVVVVSDVDAPDEATGVAFLASLYSHNNWKQTSYNTLANQHLLGGVPFRKNFAAIGYTYDETRNAFIPPKLEDIWILDEETCQWQT